jgi:hypothetical protein
MRSAPLSGERVRLRKVAFTTELNVLRYPPIAAFRTVKQHRAQYQFFDHGDGLLQHGEGYRRQCVSR